MSVEIFVEITWLGHASFRLAGDHAVVYIDPWKLSASPHDATVVFVSHSHYDHCSPGDVEKVSNAETTILAPADTAGQLPRAQAIAPGRQVTIGLVAVEAIPAYNIGKSFHPQANGWCGAVAALGPKRIYYAGDTDQIPEMDRLGTIDAALLPVGGTYTLSAGEAAQACRTIKPAVAIPYHWGDIVGSVADAQAFARQASCEVIVLQPGEKTEV